ncbi:MAG: M16 family metallopeptidase, partial [Candidatus Kapaibacteriota bacterium]
MARKPKHFKLKRANHSIFQPEVKQSILDNQILVITEKIPYFNSFALGIGVRAGSRDDFVGKEGISHFLEHCVFRRTKNYESKQINELFEKYGAYANAFTTKEYTTYYVRALNDNFEKVWNLMKEIVFEPKFDKKDIAKEKSIVKEEVRSYTEDPEEEIFDITDKYLFKHSRLSHPIVGTIRSLSNIGIEDLNHFYEKHYIPSQIVITYVGGFTHDEIVELVNREINIRPPRVEPHDRDKITIKPLTFHKNLKRQFLQCHISIAKILPNLSTRERYICAIANLLLGDCSSSRLYKSLREKSGLVYNVFSILTTYSDCSAVYIYSTTNPYK